MSTFRPTHLAAALAAAACLCAIPASASADATAVVDSTGAIVLNDDDDGNVVYVDYYGQNRILLLGYGVTPGAGCRPYHDTWDSGADCPGTTSVRLNMNGGADIVELRDSTNVVDYVVDLGAGNDHWDGSNGVSTAFGGTGDDTLEGGGDGDELHGGAGNDFIDAGWGDDRLYGDADDDTLIGDGRYSTRDADVIDGGSGHDELDDYVLPKYSDIDAPANVSFDGVANDGFPGENDAVDGVEELNFYAAADFTGSEGDDEVSWQDTNDRKPITPSHLRGMGGNDFVRGGPAADTLEGGAGADRIEARDGVADTISCGPDADTAVVDAVDVVAADCEVVDRAAAPGGSGPKPAPAPVPAPAPKPAPSRTLSRPTPATQAKLAVAARPKLAAALRSGLTVRVPGTAGKTVSATATSGGRTVARGHGKVAAGGTATVKLKFTATARRRLRRAKTVRLTVRAAGQTLSVKLAR